MWGKGEGGLGYSNSQSLTHFLLHEAPSSINCFSPVNGMLVCSKVTFITHILRWKNDKRVKEQSLLSKGEMPCRVKLIESRSGQWGVRGWYPTGFTGKSLRARDQEFPSYVLLPVWPLATFIGNKTKADWTNRISLLFKSLPIICIYLATKNLSDSPGFNTLNSIFTTLRITT